MRHEQEMGGEVSSPEELFRRMKTVSPTAAPRTLRLREVFQVHPSKTAGLTSEVEPALGMATLSGSSAQPGPVRKKMFNFENTYGTVNALSGCLVCVLCDVGRRSPYSLDYTIYCNNELIEL